MMQKRSKNDPKTIQKQFKNDLKTIQKRSKNNSKTIQKRSKSDAIFKYFFQFYFNSINILQNLIKAN